MQQAPPQLGLGTHDDRGSGSSSGSGYGSAAQDAAPAAADSPANVTLWPATSRSVHRARHVLVEKLNAWGMGGLVDVAALVLSELLTNSVRHGRVDGGREVGTRFIREDSGIRIEVHDASSEKPEMREPSADDDSGRGLLLVEALTGGRWGVSDRDGVGKLVWAYVGGDNEGAEVSR